MNKPTVRTPPGQNEEQPQKKDVSDYLVEFGCGILFLCLISLGVVGTYKLIMLMLQ